MRTTPLSADRARPQRSLGSAQPRRTRVVSPLGTRAHKTVDFFLPDSHDQIDPNYDFEREAWSPDRVRQRDDRYAHEAISPPPYTGILLSKALIEGPGKYTFAQRHRLYRLGVRKFFRL